MNQSPSDDLAKAGRITVVFLTLYSVTFVNNLVTKRRLNRQARAANKTFDRYKSPLMHKSDRLVANLLEWSPIFLGNLWALAATSNLDGVSIMAAWTYVGLRGLYIILLLQFGVASNGLNKSLWISTFPGYLCLGILWVQSIRSLFL